MRPKTDLRFAIPCVLIASFFSAATGAVAKYASPTLSIELMVFGRMLLSLIVIGLWIEFSRPVSWKEKLKTREWPVHTVRGIFGLGSVFFYYYSLKHLFLTDATLLFNVMPIFVPFVAFVWRRIPMPHQIFWGIGVAFIGLIIVLKPGVGVFQPAAGYALLAGLCGAVASVALRFAHYTEPFERTLFYFFLVGAIGSGIGVFLNAEANWKALDLQALWYLALIGLFGVAFQILYTLASKHAPVRLISVFLYAGVIFSMIFDWWLWGNPLSLSTFAGFALIVLGAWLMVYLFPKDPDPEKK
ncbi:MAG: DMT family transporter [Chlamydiales bacterium]|nr:DMT family transporter [Chlamydiales bacterium]